MTLNRDLLDQYLDSELTPAQQAQVDQELRQSPDATALLARLKHERALRLAALETYAPTPQEAAHWAQDWVASFHGQNHAPVGRIGPPWLRRLGAIAAALVIAAGSFWLGHATATPKELATIPTPPTQSAEPTGYVVKLYNPDGTMTTQEFRTRTEVDAFVQAHMGEPSATIAGVF